VYATADFVLPFVCMIENIEIGIDIEKVERFCEFQKTERNPFLELTFTVTELSYCFDQARPAEHLAGRFAAKEAVIKALANVTGNAMAHNEIEIERNKKGAPVVTLLQSELPDWDIKVSISHTNDTAVAVAVVIGNIVISNR